MEEADYVIIGAGSAGCVVANRLSVDPARRVLVLEAGGADLSPWVRMPIGYGKAFHHPKLNWRYLSEPVPGLGERSVYCPRGKVLGGSSSINAMVFIRGQRQDFDQWEALGNPGWGYRDVLPFFRRMEDNISGENEWRATGGPLAVSDVSASVHPLCANFLAAGVAAGLPLNPDFNGASQEGVGAYQITTRKGWRASTASAYLGPAKRRGNLHIATGAQATRIIFDGKRAVAVEYRSKGFSSIVRIRKELILAAGAVNSPQLLQLSGIGDPDFLKKHGIEVVHALPKVGENLQDHLGFDYLYRASRPTLNNQLGPWWGKALVGATYLLTRGGPLALSVNQAGGFFRTDPTMDRPNMQLYFSPLSYTKALPGKRRLMRPDPYPGFLLGVSNCHPKSRGHVRIRSANPFDAPAIQPNYLDEDKDLDELVDAAIFLRRLASQASMAEIIERELQPGQRVRTRSEMAQDIRLRSGSVFHLSGTCAMGPNERESVVSPRLKVHGVQNVRVIDASIFPRVVSGNTNAASIMVGERGADFVTEDAC